MNINAIKIAIAGIEANEKYYQSMKDLVRKISVPTYTGTTHSTLSALLNIGPPWDGQVFADFILPRDLLIEAIQKAERRFAAVKESSGKQLRKLLEDAECADGADSA